MIINDILQMLTERTDYFTNDLMMLYYVSTNRYF